MPLVVIKQLVCYAWVAHSQRPMLQHVKRAQLVLFLQRAPPTVPGAPLDSLQRLVQQHAMIALLEITAQLGRGNRSLALLVLVALMYQHCCLVVLKTLFVHYTVQHHQLH